MKLLISLSWCILLTTVNACAQEFPRDPGIVVYAGLINYQGDLHPNSFSFQNANPSFGIALRKPINRWFTFRAGIQVGKIEAADRNNRDYLKPRNLSFSNTITEANLGLELNILDFTTKRFSPYVYGGLSIFHSRPWTYDSSGEKTFLQPLSTEGQGLPQYPEQEPYKNYNPAIVFGGGFKYAISGSVTIGIEFCQRKTFTDYVDDVSTHYVNPDVLLQEKGPKAVELAYRGDEIPGGSPNYPPHGEQRGTASEMDWYYFLGTTIEFKLSSIRNVIKSPVRQHRHYPFRCPKNVSY